MTTITRQLLMDCQSSEGAWTRATLTALGLPWVERTPGWMLRLVGRPIREDNAAAAIAGRTVFAKKRKGGRKIYRSQTELTMDFAYPDAGVAAPGGW